MPDDVLDPNNYIGTLDEKLDAEVDDQRLDEGKFIEGICKNCLDRTYVKIHHGVQMCRMCAERYPLGMPF